MPAQSETSARKHISTLVQTATPNQLARRAGIDVYARFVRNLIDEGIITYRGSVTDEAEKIVAESAAASLKFDIHSQRARRQAIQAKSSKEIAHLAHHGNIFAQREMPQIKKDHVAKHTEDLSKTSNFYETPEELGRAKVEIALLLARLDEPNDYKIQILATAQDHPKLVPAILQNLTAKALRLKK